MAKLPNYTEVAGGAPVPKEVSGGIAQVNVPSGFDAEGVATMGMGKALIGIGEEFAREQEKIDTIKVEDAWNRYKNAALDLSIGQDGLLTTQGEAAVNGKLLSRAESTLTTTRQDIIANLGNAEQQRRFAQRADMTDLQTKHQVLAHLTTQTKEYEKTVFQGSEAAARSQITAAPTDPNVFEGARQTLVGQADRYLKSNGITDKAATQAFKDKLVDGLWTTRIDALLYTQPLLADAVFRANSQEIKSPETRLLMQARTREASIPVRAATDAEALIQEVRDIPRNTKVTLQPGSKESALQMVNAALVTNPTDYDALEAKYVLESTGEQTTSGLPNSRDVAAQLPLVLARVEKKADQVYGKDRANPDRAAYVKRLTTEIHSRIASDVQQLNAVQREAQGTLIDSIMGLGGQGGMMPTGSGGGNGVDMGAAKITSFSQLQSRPDLMRAYQRLDPAMKVSVDRMIERNNAPEKEGDTMLFRELFNRIHLEPGAAGKIDFYQQIVDPKVADRLSLPQINALRAELDRAETPGGRSLNQMRKAADQKVEMYFRTNVMFTAQPERQIAATMAWNEEVGKKIDAAAKQPNGGDIVRKMFMLDTPESVISPNYLQTFVNSTPARGVAQAAAAVQAGAPPVATPKAPANLKTQEEVSAWIATLPPGTTQFMDPAGKMRQIPARAAPAEQGPTVPASINGKQVSIPVLVPTLTPAEAREVAAGTVSDAVLAKAFEYAQKKGSDQTPYPVMSPTGKVTQPGGASGEIQMPKLVMPQTKEEKLAARAGEAAVVAVRDAQRVEKAADAVVGKPVRAAVAGAKAVAGAAEFVGGEINRVLSPDDAARAVSSFRVFIQSGKYGPAAEPVILDALESGQLTAPEAKAAAQMLRAITAAKGK